MASWSSRRKSLYGAIFVVLFGAVIVIPAYKILYVPPSCTDGEKNGDEQGIDCGGSCTKLCSIDFIPVPAASWIRFQESGPGVYNIAAYVMNPNKNASAPDIPYKITVFDRDGIPLTELSGTFDLPTARNTLVFRPGISIKNQKPARAIIEYSREPDWKLDSDHLSGLEVIDKTYDEEGFGSSLDVKLRNRTTESIERVDVYAVLKDASGNVIDFSKTVVDYIPSMGQAVAPFTWPVSHGGKAVSIEVLTVQQ